MEETFQSNTLDWSSLVINIIVSTMKVIIELKEVFTMKVFIELKQVFIILVFLVFILVHYYSYLFRIQITKIKMYVCNVIGTSNMHL